MSTFSCSEVITQGVMQGAKVAVVVAVIGLVVLGLAAGTYGAQSVTKRSGRERAGRALGSSKLGSSTTEQPFANPPPPADEEQYKCPNQKVSGVYNLQPNDTNLDRIEVYCENRLAGGDWIVIHRRESGALNFTRMWNDYKEGFGDLEAEYWLGLESMHKLTRRGQYELAVVLTDSINEVWYAYYDWFAVGPERENYMLHLGEYSGGTVRDSFSSHEGKQFSTVDRDSTSGCPSMYASGWWFTFCYEANLNGLYKPGERGDGMKWNQLGDLGLRGASMMIRKFDPVRGNHTHPY